MKVLFVWTGVTSYMADCWRRLAIRQDVDLKIIVERHSSGAEIDVTNVFAGLDATIVDTDSDIVLGDWSPDTIFAVGWHSKTIRKLVLKPRFRHIPKVCCFDMPWRWQLRCIVARWVLHVFLRHYDAAYVPGVRASRYARWLGFKNIQTGLFSLDTSRFAGIPGKRDFMFIGRDASEKRIDLLKEAYCLYKKRGGKWKFDIYGGENFVQPTKVPVLYHSHACLLLASSFDPWPLVILEATSAGLMVIASERCGNVDELGARKVPYDDASAMADAMLAAERGEIKAAGIDIATRYDSSVWCDRVVTICKSLMISQL